LSNDLFLRRWRLTKILKVMALVAIPKRRRQPRILLLLLDPAGGDAQAEASTAEMIVSDAVTIHHKAKIP
jgi:hypothetical protein